MEKGKKTEGRVKGTPNKLTKEIRAVLKNIMMEQIENISDLLKDLEPRERLELFIKLMPFALPKIKDFNYSIGEPSEFDILLHPFNFTFF